MNRQEKRRLEKQKLKNFEKNPPEFVKERETKLIVKFLGLCIETLHDEFGFGDKRVKRFADRVNEKLDSINAGYISFDDIIENLNIQEK